MLQTKRLEFCATKKCCAIQELATIQICIDSRNHFLKAIWVIFNNLLLSFPCGTVLEKNMLQLCHMVFVVMCDHFYCHFVLLRWVYLFPFCFCSLHELQLVLTCRYYSFVHASYTCIQLLLESLCWRAIIHNYFKL